jgi:hypothetical protein
MTKPEHKPVLLRIDSDGMVYRFVGRTITHRASCPRGTAAEVLETFRTEPTDEYRHSVG